MSVLDQIKALEDQRQQLIDKAKADALKRAGEAIKELAALGFTYSLTEGTTTPPSTRRKGVRQQVLDLIKKHPSGIKRADILKQLNATETKIVQSISNALAALKNDGAITNSSGSYRPAEQS